MKCKGVLRSYTNLLILRLEHLHSVKHELSIVLAVAFRL